MKIHELPMGARFEYEGEEYSKTGPLFATGKGGQRLIPKYAVLRVLDGSQPVVAKAETPLVRADVRKAFDVFCDQCAELVPDANRPALQTAREAFLKVLG
jgi:hypothetical protein